VQKAFILSLSSRQISGRDRRHLDQRHRPASASGVAQVKVGGTEDDVRKAAQRFLDQQEQIDHYSKEILSGTLRAVVGTLTVEQIIQDRASFAAQVQEESAHSMNNQGLIIDTFQISAVEDEGSYLRDWGRPQAAEVAKNAAIAEANAGRASAVEEAQQNEETQKQQALTDQAIAEQQQQLALRRAALKEEADQRQATADNAGPLATAAEKQKLLEKDRVVAKEAAELRAEQLDAEVRRPADAERYRQQAEADARAYEIEAQGRAEAAAELHRRSKDAEAIRLEGEAQADAIKARGEAEAEALRAQAEAYKQFNDAAVLSKVLEALPTVAGELVAPYANIKDLSIVSTDGESKLANSVSNNLAQVLEVVRGTTGVDLSDLVAKAKGPGGGRIVRVRRGRLVGTGRIRPTRRERVGRARRRRGWRRGRAGRRWSGWRRFGSHGRRFVSRRIRSDRARSSTGSCPTTRRRRRIGRVSIRRRSSTTAASTSTRSAMR
jgi:flotillin